MLRRFGKIKVLVLPRREACIDRIGENVHWGLDDRGAKRRRRRGEQGFEDGLALSVRLFVLRHSKRRTGTHELVAELVR